MARLDPKSREAVRRKSQKRLERVGFIPRSAKYLSEIMIVLAESSKFHRNEALSEFSRISNQKLSWEVAGRRL